MDVATLAQFTAAIHTDILVRAWRGIISKPAVDPIDGWRLCGEGTTVNPTAEVIGQ
jgi:hypothetical protein